MKPIEKKSERKRAFTIIELLTVMSIIIILIGLLVPALSRVRRYAMQVKQKAQFHSIGVALDLYNAEFEGYPPSDEWDSTGPPGQSYCGAMKLAEAMVGQDLLGFHPDSTFRNDLTSRGPGSELYATAAFPPLPTNLMRRRGPYLELGNANAYRIKNIYGVGNVAPFTGDRYVLCDIYSNVTIVRDSTDLTDTLTGKAGMPILYYRADTSKTTHNINDEDDRQNIYDYKDNDELVQLGMPFASGYEHLMDSSGGGTRHDPPDNTSDGLIFYVKMDSLGAIEDPRTWNMKVNIPSPTPVYRPQRADSYILLSAGYDGEYGTGDDVFNFDK